LQEHGEIESWEYEPDTFWFDGVKRGTRSYTPDFKVHYPDGSVVYHEVKGYMDQRSATKLKRMAKYHPDVRVILIDSQAYYSVASSVAGIVANWETRHAG
jgi:hypothetical protein